jgi:hypothetical protein
MKFTLTDIVDEIQDGLRAIRDPIGKAATLTMQQVAAELKTGGRTNIAAAGFSSKWQNAWRTRVFPTRGFSIDAAAEGRHKIVYSGVFEEGATIAGKSGLLWIPLKDTPKIGRRKATAGQLRNTGIKLFTLARPGKHPLLAARMRVPKGTTPKPSITKMRNAELGKGRGVLTAVPLFVGVKSVTLRKRFNLRGVADAIRARVPAMYAANIAAAGAE